MKLDTVSRLLVLRSSTAGGESIDESSELDAQTAAMPRAHAAVIRRRMTTLRSTLRSKQQNGEGKPDVRAMFSPAKSRQVCPCCVPVHRYASIHARACMHVCMCMFVFVCMYSCMCAQWVKLYRSHCTCIVGTASTVKVGWLVRHKTQWTMSRCQGLTSGSSGFLDWHSCTSLCKSGANNPYYILCMSDH